MAIGHGHVIPGLEANKTEKGGDRDRNSGYTSNRYPGVMSGSIWHFSRTVTATNRLMNTMDSGLAIDRYKNRAGACHGIGAGPAHKDANGRCSSVETDAIVWM